MTAMELSLMETLMAEELADLLMQVARSSPESALKTHRLLDKVSARWGSSIQDLAFDSEDEAIVRAELAEVVHDLTLPNYKSARAFRHLSQHLSHAGAYLEVGDWRSAISMLELLLEICHFRWCGTTRDILASPDAQHFFFEIHTLMERIFCAATSLSEAERTDLLAKVVKWNPAGLAEFQMPDDWCLVLVNAKRDTLLHIHNIKL